MSEEKEPDNPELAFVDPDIRECFEKMGSCSCFIGTPMLFQLVKELRALNLHLAQGLKSTKAKDPDLFCPCEHADRAHVYELVYAALLTVPLSSVWDLGSAEILAERCIAERDKFAKGKR